MLPIYPISNTFEPDWLCWLACKSKTGDQKKFELLPLHCRRSQFCCTIMQQKEIRRSWLIYNVTQSGHLGIEKKKDLWPILPQMYCPITNWHWLLVFLKVAFLFHTFTSNFSLSFDLFCFVESQIFLRKIILNVYSWSVKKQKNYCR